MSHPDSSKAPAAVECVDLTKDDSPPTDRKAVRQLWRERMRMKDEKRKAAREAQNQDGTSTSAVAGSSRTRTRSISSSGSVEVISEGNSPAQKTGTKRKKPEAAAPAPAPEPPKVAFKCPICLDTDQELREKQVSLLIPPCGHLLCKPCATSLPPECPVCRKKYKKNSLRPLFL